MNTITRKTCTKCAVEKPVSEFYRYKSGLVFSRCKTCSKARAKAYQTANREEILKKKKLYREANHTAERRQAFRYRHAILAPREQEIRYHRKRMQRQVRDEFKRVLRGPREMQVAYMMVCEFVRSFGVAYGVLTKLDMAVEARAAVDHIGAGIFEIRARAATWHAATFKNSRGSRQSVVQPVAAHENAPVASTAEASLQR